MTGESVWWIISDLHLDGSRTDPRGTTQAFASYLQSEVATSGTKDRHLALLGDTFELLNTDEPASAQLTRIERQHRDAFTALASCVGAGVTVHVVCGNHDAALAERETFNTLGSLLRAEPGDQRLRLHPWFLYMPGLLYAEHGHQHHDLNRISELPVSGWAVRRPESPPLQLWADSEGVGGARRIKRVAAAVIRSSRAERSMASLSADRGVQQAATAFGLPQGAVAELVVASRFRVIQSGVRALLRVSGRMLGFTRPGGFLHRAARRVDGILSSHGLGVPAYVFGHTHCAERQAIRPGVVYANAGTWTSDVREPHRGAAVHGAGFPVVVLRASEGRVACTVQRWRPSRTRTENAQR